MDSVLTVVCGPIVHVTRPCRDDQQSNSSERNDSVVGFIDIPLDVARLVLDGRIRAANYCSSAALRRMTCCRLPETCTEVLSHLETPRRVNFRLTRACHCVEVAEAGTHVSQTSREPPL
ncbi:hypothetical protein [Streptomyces sp. NPDC059371]|uniref:hypothetical protein n=1 Tax=Streptomyces sp. NPDC059371 TaxID=3346812 RepID=UPI0036895D0C